jgi:hypothetical protein
MRRSAYISVGFLLILVSDCKQAYLPPATKSAQNYLVVEGVINSHQDLTTIKISRTVNLSGMTNSAPELGAQVTIEGDQGYNMPLTDYGSGSYSTYINDLDPSQKYRLRIKTSNDKEYLSDYEPMKITPPIDSVGYYIKNNRVQVYANAHDPTNNTRYYRWDYTETWQFHAKYQSDYITNGSAIVGRRPDQLIYSCFGNNISSTIVLNSTAKLKQDVVYQAPITDIASTSEKIETKYSILVKQYALTQEAFNFWQNLKKNTEQLGSIFDPQPSNINGNIHCLTNPKEPVIGYISVGTIQQKRVFISAGQLPREWEPIYPYDCELDSALFCHYRQCQNDVAEFLIPIGSKEIPVSSLTANGSTIGYLASSTECVDCTIRGTKQQPDFWK